MNTIGKRIQSSTPKFFINLRWVVGIVGVLATTAQSAFDLPTIADTALDVVISLTSGSFLTTFLAKK